MRTASSAGRQKVAGRLSGLSWHGRALKKPGIAPNLAGQIKCIWSRRLREYRSGERKNESMNIVAKELTDDEIANVAAFYELIQIDVVPP